MFKAKKKWPSIQTSNYTPAGSASSLFLISTVLKQEDFLSWKAEYTYSHRLIMFDKLVCITANIWWRLKQRFYDVTRFRMRFLMSNWWRGKKKKTCPIRSWHPKAVLSDTRNKNNLIWNSDQVSCLWVIKLCMLDSITTVQCVRTVEGSFVNSIYPLRYIVIFLSFVVSVRPRAEVKPRTVLAIRTWIDKNPTFISRFGIYCFLR